MQEKKNLLVGLCLLFIILSIGVPSLIIADIATSENQDYDIVQGRGTIVYLSFEGGFYGIVSFDGNSYDPINLPPEYEIDGLRVEFVGVILDLVSFHMWGKIIKILSIRLIGV